MEFETVLGGWESMERAALPRDASAIQRREMKRAFFAGAQWMLVQSVRVSCELPESDAEAYLSAIQAEFDRFGEAIRAGHA